MTRIKTAVVPPGGWRFIIEGHTIEDSGYPELLIAIKNWKIQNGRPIGDIEKELETQMCALWPQSCHPLYHGQQVIIFDNQIRGQSLQFSDRITTWMGEIYRKPESKNHVDATEAERRAHICAVCPNNKTWQGSCANCIISVEQSGMVIRGGKDSVLKKQLNGCAVLNHDNRTAVWLPKSVLGNPAAVPNNCWLK